MLMGEGRADRESLVLATQPWENLGLTTASSGAEMAERSSIGPALVPCPAQALVSCTGGALPRLNRSWSRRCFRWRLSTNPTPCGRCQLKEIDQYAGVLNKPTHVWSLIQVRSSKSLWEGWTLHMAVRIVDTWEKVKLNLCVCVCVCVCIKYLETHSSG